MAQKKGAFGYRIKNGEIEIDKLNSKYVKRIFDNYLSGMSTNKISEEFNIEEIENQSGGTSWTHGVIGKILANSIYLGNNIYPQIIDEQVFKRVAEIREERNKNMNRNKNKYANSIVSKHCFNSKLICGECGNIFKKYLRGWSKGKESYWKCSDYKKDNHINCKCGIIDDEQLEQKFVNIVNLILSNPKVMRKTENIKLGINGLENVAVKDISEKIDYMYDRLLNEIEDIKEKEIETNIKEIEKLIFEKATAKYKTLKIDDYKYQTKKLEKIFESQKQLTEFDEELFNTIIKKVIIFLNERIEFELINGVKIEVNYNMKIKYRRKD